MLRKIIREKLDNMNDLQQRKILKELMSEVFEEIIDYQESMNQEIESRAFNEIKDIESNYDIQATIVKRDKIDLLDDFLFPIIEEDREEIKHDKEKVIDKLQKGENVLLTKVFVKKSYLEIEQLKKSNKTFAGSIISEDREIPITISLEFNNEYLKEEKKLYDIFMENSVKWKTVNNPYIRKFFNVEISGYEGNIDDLENFEEIKFNLENLGEDMFVDYIPVWNIERTKQKGEGFPLPAEDKVNYEHVLSFEAIGPENGYLLTSDNIDVKSKKRTEKNLIIISSESNSVEWNILKIVQKNKIRDEEFDFDIMSNKRKDTFVNRAFHKRNKVIRSFSELYRIVDSFKEIEDINLVDVEINNALKEEVNSTYDFNFYIMDEIRTNKYRDIMVLKFDGCQAGYLNYDLISFLVSEIQMYFPEYICKGEIV